MCRYLPLVAVVCATLSACSRAPHSTGPTKPGAAVARTPSGPESAAIGDFVIGEPVRHHNLTVFPVLSNAVQNEDRYITLDEGLQAGIVEVFELGAATIVKPAAAEPNDTVNQGSSSPRRSSDPETEPQVAQQVPVGDPFGNETNAIGNQVNRLVVVNKSDKPLYLMPGEVIVGGSQDRTIAEETIIAATGKPVPIDVYCVEHGRWGGRAVEQSVALFSTVAGESQDAERLAREASRGKFVAQAGHLNKASRLAANSNDGQQKVWDEVAKANAVSRVASESDAFTANYADQSVLDQLQPYQDAMASIGQQERMVGVIVAINGKPETTDVFESTPLFRKFWPKLLKGYSLDALHSAALDDSQQVCSADDARTFLHSVLDGQSQTNRPTDGGLVVHRRETERSVGFSASAAPTDSAAGGFGGGGFGRAVHASGFAK